MERHDYEPFGVELRPIQNQTQNTHQYTGHERDQASGLDYMHFRFYAGNMGRFMKPDNISGNMLNPQSWNKYSYVIGNPVNFNDPTGHMGASPNDTIPRNPGDNMGVGSDDSDKPSGWTRFWMWLMGKTVPEPSKESSAQAKDVQELAETGEVNETDVEATNLGQKVDKTGREATATVLGEATKQVVIQVVIGGVGKLLPILKPAGRWIGVPGSSQRIRVLSGGVGAAREMFGALGAEGKAIKAKGYPGIMLEIPGGGTIGLREASKSGPATIDLALPGVAIEKLKFPE
jgi:RHS repeat-associated protein